MAIALASTMAIVHGCVMAIVHACTIVIVHACTMAKEDTSTTRIVNASYSTGLMFLVI